MNLDQFPEPVPVPSDCVSTARAFYALFERMYPGELASHPTRDTRETYRKHIEACSRRMCHALSTGDLTAFVEDNGRRKSVPSLYWTGSQLVNLRAGKILVAHDDPRAWRELHERPSFVKRSAFLKWLGVRDKSMCPQPAGSSRRAVILKTQIAPTSIAPPVLPIPKKKNAPWSLAAADEPLLAAVRRMKEKNAALSDWAAVTAVVGDGKGIPGHGTAASKSKRLFKRLTESQN